MSIKDIMEEYSYTQTALAKKFNIPLRTVQDWSRGVRVPPSYVVEMMHTILEYEK